MLLFNRCTKCMGSQGIIHDCTPDCFLQHFVLAKLATSSIRVKMVRTVLGMDGLNHVHFPDSADGKCIEKLANNTIQSAYLFVPVVP